MGRALVGIMGERGREDSQEEVKGRIGGKREEGRGGESRVREGSRERQSAVAASPPSLLSCTSPGPLAHPAGLYFIPNFPYFPFTPPTQTLPTNTQASQAPVHMRVILETGVISEKFAPKSEVSTRLPARVWVKWPPIGANRQVFYFSGYATTPPTCTLPGSPFPWPGPLP